MVTSSSRPVTITSAKLCKVLGEPKIAEGRPDPQVVHRGMRLPAERGGQSRRGGTAIMIDGNPAAVERPPYRKRRRSLELRLFSLHVYCNGKMISAKIQQRSPAKSQKRRPKGRSP
jgi:hypothetical protein